MIKTFKLNITFTCLLLFAIAFCFSQDSTTAFKIKQYTKKVENFLDKSKALSPYYAINANGISIYESAQNKLKGISEFHISWDKIDEFNKTLKNCPIQQVFETYKKGDYNKKNICMGLNPSPLGRSVGV